MVQPDRRKQVEANGDSAHGRYQYKWKDKEDRKQKDPFQRPFQILEVIKRSNVEGQVAALRKHQQPSSHAARQGQLQVRSFRRHGHRTRQIAPKILHVHQQLAD